MNGLMNKLKVQQCGKLNVIFLNALNHIECKPSNFIWNAHYRLRLFPKFPIKQQPNEKIIKNFSFLPLSN